MKKYILLPIVSAFFVGCAGTTSSTQAVSTPQVLSALSNYQRAKKDKLINEYAAQQIYKASKISSKVRVQTDEELANHFAYLLNNQVKIASLVAEEQEIQEGLNDVIIQRNEAIDAINTQRAEEENIGVNGRVIDSSAIQSDFSYQVNGSSQSYTISGQYFDNEMVRFNAKLKDFVAYLARELKSNNKQVILKSYTDDAGSTSYNIDIATRRAQMIKDNLVDKDIDASRITIKGLGGVDFISPNNSTQARAKNNRIEVNLIDASN